MPLRIQAIVCAVDFSTFSPLVVAHGMALARRAGVRLYLVHAIHHPQDDLHPTALFERGGDLAALRHGAQQRMAALMTFADLAWEAVICFGEPVTQIAAEVDRLPPSLVVSASHGVSGFQRLFIGTVVERLTRALARPMLVVKPGDADKGSVDGFRSAVIGCDHHGHWRRLAPLLPLLQTDPGSALHLVHVMEGPLDGLPLEAEEATYGQVQRVHQDRIRRELADSARRLFPRVESSRLSIDVASGVPQEMLLQAVHERRSELVVVGVRPSGKVGRWIAGSTTETLLRRSPCSVLTLPEPKKVAPKEDADP